MIGALWTGISGLSSQQQALDNESNNIANVNTIGFKSSRISFADQMYQDRIGKGSKILDAEKLYTQGNLKLTGVSYDMALSGEGFFTVANTRATGTTENFYTRAGNFRMGDNGTLQDSAGNEVQGWMMTTIDPAKDVTSTNPNVDAFTNDYTKLLSSKIIKHSTYVETITAKATDYTQTAKEDSSTVFSGAGMKTKGAKISDIEAAIKDYATWLQRLSEEPDGSSATSIAQVSHINFKSGSDSALSKEGDQLYVYINGEKKSQNYVSVTATDQLKADLYGNATVQADYGLADPSGTLTSAEEEVYNKLASRIETYKGLANTVSEMSGLVAYVADEVNAGGINDVLESDDSFTPNTVDLDQMLKGIIQIKSLIPGQAFTISEVGEIAGGGAPLQGNYLTQTEAQAGTGLGALESSKEALSRLVTGKQRDVYTESDLRMGNSPLYTYNITIYDKELGQNISVPNDGGTPPQPVPIFIDASATNGTPSIDDMVKGINSGLNNLGVALDPPLSKYIEAKNVNGILVVETKEENYDVEFTGLIKQLPSVKVDLNEIIDNADYSFNLSVDGTSTSIGHNFTANNTLTATQVYNEIKDNFDPLYPNPTDEIKISSLSADGTFLIYSTNEDTSFAGSLTGIPSRNTINPISYTGITSTVGVSTTMEVNTLTITAGNPSYSFDIMGETITATGATEADIYNDILNKINANSNLSGLVTVGSLSGTSFSITQTGIQTPSTPPPVGLGLSVNAGNLTPATTVAFVAGNAETMDVSFTPNNNQPISEYTLNIGSVNLTYTSDQTPTGAEIAAAFNGMIPSSSNIALISWTGAALRITEKLDSNGYTGLATPSLSVSEITDTITSLVTETLPLDKNNNFSGREGAGAEFLQIINKIDQTATKGSLQLRLDTLGISSSAFGEFSVDNTGLIMMKQDGADFAIGQVAIALFNNNRGLSPSGDNLLAKTNDSGEPIFNLNNDKTAKVETKTLELSTADLSESLVNLMVFQRAFEANAKSITTSDQLLNTLINLKR